MKKKETDPCRGPVSASTLAFLGTWLLAAASWIAAGEIPVALVQHVALAHGICFASYCCKCAYENGQKIKGNGGGQA